MTENKRFENRLNKNIKKFNVLNPVWDNEKETALNVFEMIDEMNNLNNENEFSKNRIASLNNLLLNGLSKDNVDEVIYQKYVWYTNFHDDLTRSEKLLVANFADFLIDNLFESLKKME
ncbi:MAG: hypothetical protein J6M08_02135 [Methanobrevibacter sp.]|nr:hypothetical protein [Methanobrevibacter sp.]